MADNKGLQDEAPHRRFASITLISGYRKKPGTKRSNEAAVITAFGFGGG